MPPEQATGRRGTLSRRSDVYALGAILYHALTGRPPFVGEGLAETVQQVLNTEPVSLRALNPGVPADLDTVCLKCLEKEPGKRYATANMLAEELDRFLEGQPVLARPVGRLPKTWRWGRRNPALAGTGAVAVLAVLLGLIGVLWQLQRVEFQRQRAEAGELSARRRAYISEIPNPKLIRTASSGVTFGNTAKPTPKRSWASFPVAFAPWKCRPTHAGSWPDRHAAP